MELTTRTLKFQMKQHKVRAATDLVVISAAQQMEAVSRQNLVCPPRFAIGGRRAVGTGWTRIEEPVHFK